MNVGNAQKPEWVDQIWFDNFPVQSPSFAMLLRTSRSPGTEQALTRIRGLWDGAGYTRPKPV